MATRCSSPPESESVRRSSSCATPIVSATSSTARAMAPPVLAAVLQRQRDLGPHPAHHDLRLGVLEDRPADGGQLGRTVLAQVQAADGQPPARVPAVEVRHQAAQRPQQRRLARPRQAGKHGERALVELQVDEGERVDVAAAVAVAEALRAREHLRHAPPPPTGPRGRRTAAQPPAARPRRPPAPTGRAPSPAWGTPAPSRRRRCAVPPPRPTIRAAAANTRASWRERRRRSRARAHRARVAAHLQRGRHVDGPLQRARQRGARHLQPAGGHRPAARGVAHPGGVAGQHRHQPGGQHRRQRRAVGEAPQHPQHVVLVHARREQREGHAEHHHAVALDQPRHRGLEGDVEAVAQPGAAA